VQFQGWAKEIGDVSDVQQERMFSIIKSLSKSATASALTLNKTFPFFTVPYFDVKGGEAQEISGAEVVIYVPLVKTSEKERWENYASANQGWVKEGLAYRGLPDIDPGPVPEQVYSYKDTHGTHKEGQIHVDGYILPIWQIAGAPRNASIVNLDLMTRSSFEHTMFDVIQQREGILSDVCNFNYLTENSVERDEELSVQSYMLEPVFESFDENANVVGFIAAVFGWNNFFKNILPDAVDGLIIVIDDKCGDIFTYEIKGADAVFLGKDDRHDSAYDSSKYSIDFATAHRATASHPDVNGTSFTEHFEDTSKGHCKYTLDVYPSSQLESMFTSNKHIVYAVIVASIFGLLMILLLIYDCMVTHRQQMLMSSAERTNALVTSLFPESVQNRLMDDAVQSGKGSKKHIGSNMFGDDSNNGPTSITTRPIADLFPNTTVMFADIAGFTSWSSAREPSQVFVLLETIYQAFDEIAKRRRVFKVETIGDCYVAAVGLPTPRKDHAVVMARFAQDCLSRFSMLVKKMEVTLGPDTGELGLRTGLHSGPVTAGVLRGEKSRFQLFGDTVNTTARIETTGERDKIHISQEHAELLISAGKEHWIQQREDKVVAKGKGELVTYWLEPKVSRRQSSCGSSRSDDDDFISENTVQESSETLNADDSLEDADTGAVATRFSKKTLNLIQWNADMLANLLKVIIARRSDSGGHPSDRDKIQALEQESLSKHRCTNRMVEAEETIHLPGVSTPSHEHSIELSEAVTSQLLKFVHTIASMYPNNPFHNFEHASHVTMSVQKLLCRIVAQTPTEAAQESHDRTYGITSDPLIHFSMVLSALIHDVDHPGVPNATLVQEESSLAALYKNKSVAEQNSIDLAWDLLMDNDFVDLRRVLYTTTDEFRLFQKVVVKSVVATDIMDKQLGACRKKRWAKAFEINQDNDVTAPEECPKDAADRKATIVLEHVIQASDIAHTMQHWHIYLKWNERLFHEMYKAFLDGRSSQDPSKNWYNGELGFFDFYILPLAKKLESCGCFGVSGVEYLNYATKNRKEWERNGKEAVERYLETYRVSNSLCFSKRGSLSNVFSE
jgi:class 3 adenylate cyclase